ncbi:TPA: EamA family transporter [Candidatus Woesearchaeota archaeon]|nr:EamA family transporter [Candidatus Woesearchaeota archaeon]
MAWLVWAIIAVIVWTVINIIDKFAVSKELKDAYLATTVIGFTIAPIFLILPLTQGSIMIPWVSILFAIAAGSIYRIAGILYYYVLQKEEVSKAMPIMGSSPIFIILIAFLFLGERLTPLKYYGIVLVLLGSFLLSLKNVRHFFSLDKMLLLAALAAFCYALRSVFLKVASTGNMWPVLFWTGVGVTITTTVIYAIHHPHIHKKAKEGVKHLVVSGFLSGIALIVYLAALSSGPLSIVATIEATLPLFVFMAATLISRFHPRIIHEKLSTPALLQKMASILLIVAGTSLIL